MYSCIGIVIATQEELDAFCRKMQRHNHNQRPRVLNIGEFEILVWGSEISGIRGASLVVAHSHAGEISAAANTQLLISQFGVEVIINYGVAGAMVDGICVGDIFVVDRIIHYDFSLEDADHHYPRGYYPSYGTRYLEPPKDLLNLVRRSVDGIPRITCFSSDAFIGKTRKRRLADVSRAQICEMECAGVYLTCRKNGIPCLILKSISDAVDEDAAEAFNANVDSASEACAEILIEILKRI